MLPTRHSVFVSALTAFIVGGCADAVATKTPLIPPPTDDTSPRTVTPFSTTQQLGRPGQRASTTPTVLVRDRLARPVAGIQVSFTVSGGGSLGVASTTTTAYGTASPGSWTLGAGENTVVATVLGIGSVTFHAEGRAVVLPVERYDLLTVGGHSLPIVYSGGGKSWSTVEGHYEFDSAGTFDFWQVWVFSDEPSRRDSVLITGGYTRQGASMSVTLPGLYGSGTLTGDRLSIAYSEPLAWEPEVYFRAR